MNKNRNPYAEKYRKRHREKIRQYDKEHAGERKLYFKEYYKENMEKKKQHYKQNYEDHKEEIRQRHKRYKEEHKKELRQHFVQKKYGLSPEEYDAMLKAQDNKCAICKKQFKDTKHIHIDHDHTTGKVRGILCSYCNTMLGMAHDNLEILQEGINYLKRHNNGKDQR